MSEGIFHNYLENFEHSVSHHILIDVTIRFQGPSSHKEEEEMKKGSGEEFSVWPWTPLNPSI